MTLVQDGTITRLHDDPMIPVVHTIVRVKRETPDTFTIDLQAADCRPGRGFLPGQFNMLYLFGVGEAPISISGDPQQSDGLTHTTRAVGSVTRALEALKVGGSLGVRGPFGNPWPVGRMTGRDVIVVCGGIGLAPLRPVLYHLVRNRRHYNRVVLLYGARTADELLYRPELARWSDRADVDVLTTVDRATTGWRGNVGVVTSLIARAPLDRGNAVVLICGPEIMMRYSIMELTRRGIDGRDIYVSMERNMKCGIGLCGHCQYGGAFVCKEGPVFRFQDIASQFEVQEL